MKKNTEKKGKEFLNSEYLPKTDKTIHENIDTFKENKLDEIIKEQDIKLTDKPSDLSFISFEIIEQQYKDHIEQSAKISGTLAQHISMADLSSSDQVVNSLMEIEAICNKKTMIEKTTTALLPKFVNDRLLKYTKNIEKEMIKSKNVAEVATHHFNALSDKRDYLTKNLGSIYEIRDKLIQSDEILDNIKINVHNNLLILNGKIDASSKKDLLRGKEMMVQISSQILAGKDLIGQIDGVDHIAGLVLDNINQTLPSIKNNFIDQISISVGLNTLKNLKDSVSKTKEMTLRMQETAFEDMQLITNEIIDEGIGYSDSDMDRIRKLEAKKQKYNKEIANKLVNESKRLDKKIKEINELTENKKSAFSSENLKGIEYDIKNKDN
jgi:hypothetical protein